MNSRKLSFDEFVAKEKREYGLDLGDEAKMHRAWDAALAQQAQRCKHGATSAHPVGITGWSEPCPGPQQAQPSDLSVNARFLVDGKCRDLEILHATIIALCDAQQAQPEMPTREMIAEALFTVYGDKSANDLAADAVLAVIVPKDSHAD